MVGRVMAVVEVRRYAEPPDTNQARQFQVTVVAPDAVRTFRKYSPPVAARSIQVAFRTPCSIEPATSWPADAACVEVRTVRSAKIVLMRMLPITTEMITVSPAAMSSSIRVKPRWSRRSALMSMLRP